MVKIAHECPKSIFSEIEKVTDYSYALVHLFEEDPEYLALFKQAKAAGREIILDNSIFELEEAFDAEKYAYWIRELEPTWYIVPDALEDADKTMNQMSDWLEKYNDSYGKKIGVIQGKTYEQLKRCYEYMNYIAKVDMIAISFDYSYYTTSVPHSNKHVSWMLGRVKLLGDLLKDGIINTDKKHHLLGISLPQEGLYYKHSNYDWIYSIDTSNPIVHGIKKVPYLDVGLFTKESQKLVEMIDYKVEDTNLIMNNLYKFRYFWNKSSWNLHS
jgi:hypothetical protein